jgi:DNA-binding CsgD family transcriptional regulator
MSQQMSSTALSQDLHESLRRSSLSWDLLDQVGCGICLVDESMRLVYANELANDLTEESWFMEGGFCAKQCVPPSLRLREGVLCALSGRANIVQVFESGVCLLLALSPVALGAGRKGVLITSERVRVVSNSAFRIYARALRLTTREVEVLKQLSAGLEPKVAADAMCMSVETIRSHIKSILSKAAAGSLRELLLRVAKLPPLIELADQGIVSLQ